MAGMSRTTGAAIDGAEDIRQSLGDILGTKIGTRVGRRDYGSLVPDLIDQPLNAANILRLYAASALAVSRWENRVRLRRVSLAPGARAGAATLNLDADVKGLPPASARTRFALSL
jgi:phage baseplate assembly protein W